jgi:hypothetical protein
MRIYIKLQRELLEYDDEIEIFVGIQDEIRISKEEMVAPANEYFAKTWEMEDHEPFFQQLMIDITLVVLAIFYDRQQRIGLDPGFGRYENTDGYVYTHPGDVAQGVNLYRQRNAMPDADHEVSSQTVGRAMQHKMGLRSYTRKSTGVPYYKRDNEEQLNRLVEEFALDVPDKWLEEDGDGSED